MKQKVFLVVYGRGGHQEQMRRLVAQLSKCGDTGFVSIADVEDKLGAVEHLVCPEPRDKFSFWSAPFKLCYTALVTLWQTLLLLRKYDVTGLVSTGPGMTVIPGVLLRLVGKPVIYIESWSRFYSGSLTGKFMYRITKDFYVQNASMLSVFPKARYAGRL
ncbi:PssD/Cps14F family polysaccharide biosynthesis glycosyltransferase [Shewanella sp. FJAT-52076]|uniref:PssD/Cps14F family polysaccharide biosynthesis glycosyltransferase n=1 Tax=Shewanella sp. FJAT-52076 TaxID=2864202 RepID=UPI001C661D51|nr:PssD/Cps14F family polysaccharide biosynthesis glycosyltransferase [Shewanella sp. FJAT-52076]QYJ74042.1 hypothetical protein K0H79_11705 [Shewanella sp. FJAT-52076]